MITLKIDTKALEQAKQALASMPRAFNNAMKKSVKRTLESMRAEASRQARETYYVKAGAVREAIKPVQVRGNGGQLFIQGQRMSIADFRMSPRMRPRGKQQHGLNVAVRRDSGIHHLKRGFLLYHDTPFLRVGPKRGDIKPITTLAVPQMMNNPDIQQAIIEKGQEAFSKTFSFWVNKSLSVKK